MHIPADPAVLKTQALDLFHAGKLPDARMLCEEICRQAPGDAEVWHLLTAINGMLGLYVEAETCARRVISLHPGFHGAYNNLGHALLELGREEDARECFAQALRLKPDDAEARNHLGTICCRRKDYATAAEYFREALASNPGYAEAENNLGTALQYLSKPDESMTHYQRAVRLNPQFTQAWINIGNLSIEMGRFDDALASFRQVSDREPGNENALLGIAEALRRKGQTEAAMAVLRQVTTLNPGCAQAYFSLGQLSILRNRHEDALADLRQALNIDPGNAVTLFHLGYVCRKLGQTERALEYLREALKNNPEHSASRLLLAGLGAVPVPASPGADYVADLFDGYADTFEQHLVTGLEYRIPWVLQQKLLPYVTPARGKLDILDMGCGTGLCGQVFRSWAGRLIGVDLSLGMIRKAKARGVYDTLVTGDILVPLQTAGAVFDLVLAADVFIYVGDLQNVFKACKTGLKPAGILAFSIEELEQGGGDYVVRSSMRYAHSVSYIRDLADAYGFCVLVMDRAMIRKEAETAIQGYVAVLRNSG